MADHPKRNTARNTRSARKPRGLITDKSPTADKPTKLDLLVALLVRPEGASLAELTAATGWQAHSVRGALAGSLRKKGHAVQSAKIDGLRRYRIGAAW